MNLEKITRIGCIALGVLGVIFLGIVFARILQDFKLKKEFNKIHGCKNYLSLIHI